jgi:hypothetical protein
MSKTKLTMMASATSKEALTKLINEYFESADYCISDALELIDKSVNYVLQRYVVKFRRNRYQFLRVTN